MKREIFGVAPCGLELQVVLPVVGNTTIIGGDVLQTCVGSLGLSNFALVDQYPPRNHAAASTAVVDDSAPLAKDFTCFMH